MARTPKRGATAPPKGVYQTPETAGVRDTDESNTYRRAPVATKDISEIGYVPYGGVYEREGIHPADTVAPGGAYERPVEEVTELESIYISSQTYPPATIEDLFLDCTITGGSLRSVIVEDIDLDALITGGTLGTLLLEYTMQAEDVDLDALITSGTIATVLLSYTMQAEDVDLDALITSGTLVNVLITYSNWPAEDIDLDALITGGTLV